MLMRMRKCMAPVHSIFLFHKSSETDNCGPEGTWRLQWPSSLSKARDGDYAVSSSFQTFWTVNHSKNIKFIGTLSAYKTL